MTKILVVLKTVFYFASLVLPVIDACKGAVAGVKQAVKEKAYSDEVKDIYEYIKTETIDELSELEEDE